MAWVGAARTSATTLAPSADQSSFHLDTWYIAGLPIKDSICEMAVLPAQPLKDAADEHALRDREPVLTLLGLEVRPLPSLG